MSTYTGPYLAVPLAEPVTLQGHKFSSRWFAVDLLNQAGSHLGRYYSEAYRLGRVECVGPLRVLVCFGEGPDSEECWLNPYDLAEAYR